MEPTHGFSSLGQMTGSTRKYLEFISWLFPYVLILLGRGRQRFFPHAFLIAQTGEIFSALGMGSNYIRYGLGIDLTTHPPLKALIVARDASKHIGAGSLEQCHHLLDGCNSRIFLKIASFGLVNNVNGDLCIHLENRRRVMFGSLWVIDWLDMIDKGDPPVYDLPPPSWQFPAPNSRFVAFGATISRVYVPVNRFFSVWHLTLSIWYSLIGAKPKWMDHCLSSTLPTQPLLRLVAWVRGRWDSGLCVNVQRQGSRIRSRWRIFLLIKT